jgi:hypothetical protein
MMVHIDYEINENGTLASHSGSLIHVGQLFYDETWNDQVATVYPYSVNTNSRTYNDEDSILATAFEDGFNAYVEYALSFLYCRVMLTSLYSLELLGSDVSEGLLGYITVGVDTTASYSISNTNYLNSTDSSA